MTIRRWIMLAVGGFIVAVICNGCSEYTQQYSILESSPYADYVNHVTPPYTFRSGLKDPGMNLLFDAGYDRTLTDADTSTGAGFVTMTARFAPFAWLEPGLGLSARVYDGVYLGFNGDVKFAVLRAPFILCPDLGFATSAGRVGWTFTIQASLLMGASISEDRVKAYVTPRYINLIYPYERRYGDFGRQTYFATATIYGASVGFSYVKHSEGQGAGLVIGPEFTFLIGEEPVLERINLKVLQLGLRCGFMN